MGVSQAFDAALSKRANPRQEVISRSAFVARGPSDQIRPQIKEHEDSLGTSWRNLEATLGAEAAPSSWLERRRWGDEASTPARPHPTRLALARVIR